MSTVREKNKKFGVEDKEEKATAINDDESIYVNLTFRPEEIQKNEGECKKEQALQDSANNRLENISFEGKDLVITNIQVENDGVKLTCRSEENQKNDSFCIKEQALAIPTNIKAENINISFEDKDLFISGIEIENNGVKLTIKSEENQGKDTKGEEKDALADTADIEVENINISFDGNDLLKNASLLIASGKRYGLVGSKNCGKTTLLERIANREFGIPSDLDVLYWKQDIADSSMSVMDFVSAPSEKCAKLLAEREKLKAEQEKENCDSAVKERLAELWEELLMIDPQGIPARAKAKKILFGLGFFSQTLWKTVTDIPKYLRKRVSLARVLFLEPTLLILDEPTAELDINAVIWLKNYLQDWKKTLIVVCQDRCFLDSICNEIVCVKQQKLFQYEGNYSSFEQSVQNRESSKTGVNPQTGAMSKSLSQNKMEANNSQEGKPSVEQLEKPVFMFFDRVDWDRRDLVELKNVTFRYEKKKDSAPIFRNMWCTICYESKLVVLGPSKVGKSTLFKLASGELKPEKGQVKVHPEKISIGIFDKNSIGQLPAEQSPLEYMMEAFKLQHYEAVKQLSRLGLASHFHTVKMNALSNSEKARVALAKFCLIPYDALFLDEPTRYLDIEMIDALAVAIHRFKGGLMMVTNNEFLIRETECYLNCVQDHELDWVEDFEEYRKEVLTELNEPIRGPFTYKRKIPSALRVILQSNSKIIENYIKNTGADPNIKEIGKYRIIFSESTRSWCCYSPTLPANSCGITKEACHRSMCELIEWLIEGFIEDGREVPSPP